MDPLLERGEEPAALESVVQEARDGRGQLVLVAGEAGTGMSQPVERGGGVVLYTDGLTEAEASGVLRGRASEFADGILTDDICLLAACIT